MQAQLSSSGISDLAQKEAEKISLVLNLTKHNKKKIAEVYSLYYGQLGNAIKAPKNYTRNVELAEKTKNTSIEKILGNAKFKSYQIFESIYTNESLEYFKTLSTSINKIEGLEIEIAEYYRLKIFPVISKLRLDFNEKLAYKDRQKIDNIKDTIYTNLTIYNDSLVVDNSENQSQLYYDLLSFSSKYDDDIAQVYYDLLSFSSKYDDDIAQVYLKVDPFVSRWTSDIEDILGQYYTENQVENFANQDIELKKLGVLGSINEMSFLLLEPYSIQKFYKNLLLVQQIKNSLTEIRAKN